jgi:uncharacterized membrane protein
MKRIVYQYSQMLWTILLGAAAIAHITHGEFFAAYYPDYLPWPEAMIFATAVLELALALMLWVQRTKRIAWGVISMLMLLYLSVHVYVVTDYDSIVHPVPAVPLWAAWLRLLLHPLLIVWPAWAAARLIPQFRSQPCDSPPLPPSRGREGGARIDQSE